MWDVGGVNVDYRVIGLNITIITIATKVYLNEDWVGSMWCILPRFIGSDSMISRGVITRGSGVPSNTIMFINSSSLM